ncbi:EF-hand domain-containing protein [Phyllobacterium sp. LjRoot231]
MKIYNVSLALIGMISAIAACITTSGAGEILGFPPRDPPGVVRPKMNQATVQQAVDQQMKSRFESAAGSGKVLTAQQASEAGWGFISDHFAEIDRDKDGFVSFSDVSRFMAPRSPLSKAPVQPAGTKPIQIIE